MSRSSLAAVAASLLLSLTLPAAWAQTASPPARVIVKYKATSASTAASGASQKQAQATLAAPSARRAAELGQRLGLGLRDGPVLAKRMQLVTGQGMKSEDLAERLNALPEVEYAVPDQWRRPVAVPNDPLYPGANAVANGPAAGQWYLRTPDSTIKAAIDAETAWNTTTGSSSIVVAVLDTGVRPDHADLAANLLPGVDMVSVPDVANDGDARDMDPSDPGDWIEAADKTAHPTLFSTCTIENSTWHGTGTAALIGAVTNNGTGMASVGRNVKILPVRVLGKCGGYDSDILAGMLWAVGLPADAALTDNPPANKARILNLSLGGDGACTQAYKDVIQDVVGQGALVVVAAGNGNGHAVGAPANCPGVVAVGGLRQVGTKVGFSDLGPEVTVSAPGGNCVNSTDPCLYPILTASNSGTKAPVADGAGGSIYSDGRTAHATLGTSFSAPLVAGTAALMLSVDPTLTPEDLRNLLISSARTFPTGSPACHAPNATAQDECFCTTGTCGAGMLDAKAAVLAAQTGFIARMDVTGSPAVNTALTFSAADTVLASGRSLAASNPYRWDVLAGGSGNLRITATADPAVVTVTPLAGGTFKVRLTVTDDQSNTAMTDQVFSVAAPPPVAQPRDSGGGGAVGAAWLAGLLAGILALQLLRRREARAARQVRN